MPQNYAKSQQTKNSKTITRSTHRHIHIYAYQYVRWWMDVLEAWIRFYSSQRLPVLALTLVDIAEKNYLSRCLLTIGMWNSTIKELFPLLQSKGIAFGLLRAWKLRPLETQCSRLKLSKRSIEMWSLTSIPWNPMREILQFFEGETKGIKCLLKSKRYTVSYTEKLSWKYCTSVYWKPCKYNVVIDPSFLHPSNLIKSPRVPFLLFCTQK